jgi:small subunit ribosomal protein S21
MTEIVIGENDRLEWALKAFRRKVQRSGVLQELRGRRFYLKPSKAKRAKAAAARRRRQAAARRAARNNS